MIYRAIGSAELSPALFAHFDRRQEVTLCYRRAADGSWCVRPDPFTDDWDAADYAFLVQCLRRTLERGGADRGHSKKDCRSSPFSISDLSKVIRARSCRS